ncbi:hypothetical protein AALB16_03145 [Lachnospiraceae bacterium 62-35]
MDRKIDISIGRERLEDDILRGCIIPNITLAINIDDCDKVSSRLTKYREYDRAVWACGEVWYG